MPSLPFVPAASPRSGFPGWVSSLALIFVFALALASSASAQPAASAPEKKPRESWDAIFMANTRVGYVHTTVEPVADSAGNPLVRVTVEIQFRVRRGRDQVEVRQIHGTIETLEGEVLRLQTRTVDGDNVIETSGDVRDGQMVMTLDLGGRPQQSTIPWSSEIRGPYAIEQSLARAPLEPGQTRVLQMFVPDFNKVVRMTLRAAERRESTEIAGGVDRELLRITAEARDESGKRLPVLDQVQWVGTTGQIFKTQYKSMKMMAYRTTRRAALAESDQPGRFDLLGDSIIRLDRPIRNSDQLRFARLRITLSEGTPGDHFPNDHRQRLETGNRTNVATLVVRTDSPSSGRPGPSQVDPAYLQPNALITSDDPEVIRLARSASRGRRDPWQRVLAVRDWVSRNIREKNFETVFDPASKVCRDRAGDCTEHSVLTAAMCRALGVPARIVVGLVYSPQASGFGFHMWNEVYVNRRWVAIDATFDQDQVDALHLKMSTSSLDGVAPFETFLAVAQLFQAVEITPLELR